MKWVVGLNINDSEKHGPGDSSAPSPGHYTCISTQYEYSNLFLPETTKSWPNQSQILYEASIGRGNQCEHEKYRSHDQDDYHAHIW